MCCIQDTRNIVHRTMTPQSPSKEVPSDLTQFSQHLFHYSKHSAKSFVRITISCLIYSSILSTIRNLFPFKGDLSFGKSQKSLLTAACTCSIFSGGLLVAGLPERGSLRSSTIFKEFLPHFYLHCTHYIVPESLLNHLNSSMEECASSIKIHCSTHSVILNVMDTEYTCSLNHSTAFTTPTDKNSEVVIVQARTFHSTLLGCKVMSMQYKLFLLY